MRQSRSTEIRIFLAVEEGQVGLPVRETSRKHGLGYKTV